MVYKKGGRRRCVFKINVAVHFYFTASNVIPHLKKFKNLTVITNSPKNSLKLAELKIKSFSTGGILLENSVAYVGTSAQNFIKQFNADLFSFSCRGAHDGILNDSSIEETDLRKVMMRQSKKIFFFVRATSWVKCLCTIYAAIKR